MEKTHYERILEHGDLFMLRVFEKLKTELPAPGGVFGWDELVKTPTIMQMSLLMNDRNVEDITSITQMVYHTYSFYKGDGRVYEVSPNIAEMLLNTEMDVDSSVVKSPFREIIVVVPDDLIQIYNRDTGMHNVYTLYINFAEDTEESKTLKILCVGRPNQRSTNTFDDAMFYFKIPLGPGRVSESLKKEQEKWAVDPQHQIFATMNDDLMPRLFQFTLNILLYITSAESDIRIVKSEYEAFRKKRDGLKNPAKVRKLQQKIDRETKLHRYVVGGSVQLSSEEKSLYDAVRGGKHTVRYPVGGFWRMQPYGPRENPEKRIKWIRPHFRGPEIAELIRSIGVLK